VAPWCNSIYVRWCAAARLLYICNRSAESMSKCCWCARRLYSSPPTSLLLLKTLPLKLLKLPLCAPSWCIGETSSLSWAFKVVRSSRTIPRVVCFFSIYNTSAVAEYSNCLLFFARQLHNICEDNIRTAILYELEWYVLCHGLCVTLLYCGRRDSSRSQQQQCPVAGFVCSNCRPFNGREYNKIIAPPRQFYFSPLFGF
jgi:hypothetical protein